LREAQSLKSCSPRECGGLCFRATVPELGMTSAERKPRWCAGNICVVIRGDLRGGRTRLRRSATLQTSRVWFALQRLGSLAKSPAPRMWRVALPRNRAGIMNNIRRTQAPLVRREYVRGYLGGISEEGERGCAEAQPSKRLGCPVRCRKLPEIRLQRAY
jgi:hypothetical protein